MTTRMPELSWVIGGQQGEGIESAGDSFAAVLNQLGYYLYGYRHFSSRIKGGHTHYKIRASQKAVGTVSDATDILVAFDQETIDLNQPVMHSGGVILADARFKPVSAAMPAPPALVSLPLTELAAAQGSPLMKNSVGLGATAAVAGLSPAVFDKALAAAFAHKRPGLFAANQAALQAGYGYIRDNAPQLCGRFSLTPLAAAQRLFMLGNEAIALGALAAGAKFMAAYPITPASEIMEYLIKKLPEFGGAVIQTEDEIAACMMAIGAGYAGARAFTATSGPGFSLMQEGIGLAAMTETPLVVIDAQRGGPSTGLPTKHEQSDILAAVYGTHGDAPKIVMAPGTAAEAFSDAAEAFNLADEYQCPVILLSDLQLSLCKQTLELPELERVTVRRGKIKTAAELPPLPPKGYFSRFAAAADGISDRVLPGTANGMHLVTGLEHDVAGRPSEAAANRIAQTDKRLGKLATVAERFSLPLYRQTPHEQPDLLVIGAGGSRGAIEEAVASLNAAGYRVNHVHLRLLQPLPLPQLRPLLAAAKRILTVEHNASAQLAVLLGAEAGRPLHSLRKYDGNILLPAEVYQTCREVLA